MTKWKKAKIELSNAAEKKPVPIVADAVVASRGMAEGRMIPLLIIDTSQRGDIEDMVRAHEHFGPGDATSAWALPSRFDKSRIRLVLSVTKPGRCVIILEFDVALQGGVVDQIVHAQGVYLQPGRPGDRLVSTIEKNRILVEVPSTEFRNDWDRIFQTALNKEFRRRGLPRSKAKQASQDFMNEWRRFGAIRMKSD